MQKTKLVTCALPYANGDIHLGHMLEHIQADIWVRFQRLQGQRCYFICADDTHGTPIMLKSAALGITPEQLIANYYSSHTRDLIAFGINYDNFYTTNSPENRELAYQIYAQLQANNKIVRRTISQLFDQEKEMFLPDRFVKGTCPRCKAEDQYGDSCEKCGATYSPTELINPHSVVSGSTPILKESEHYFFKLSECADYLKEWLAAPERLPIESRNKMQEWLDSGLQDWDISRDKPYFGFEIPDAPGKYFYVWLDAPVGYLSSLKNYCTKQGLDFNALWNGDNSEIYHFIGKDILYFHALFWPAVLHHAGFRTPDHICVHGFLTVNGQKMSKSRGTFITAQSLVASGINPEFFRYYVASKLSNKVEDIDLALADFIARINSDLVGKFINIASRSSGFISKRFNSTLGAVVDNELLQQCRSLKLELAELYATREFAKSLKLVMQLVDEVNQYVDTKKPWLLAKDPTKEDELLLVCTSLLNAFKIIAVYLKPVIPELVAKIESFLNVEPLLWSEIDNTLINHKIQAYTHLINRMEPTMLEKMLELNQESVVTTPPIVAKVPDVTVAVADAAAAIVDSVAVEYEAVAPTITLDEFSKVDLRVAKIIEANHVPGADKLIQLTLDIGNEVRNVFAGIKAAYDPALLVGKYTVMVANLAPRKMKFGISEGMVLAASFADKESGLYILEPHSGAVPGMRIR